jgi:hypothetical protein
MGVDRPASAAIPAGLESRANAIDVTIDDPKAYTRPFTVRVNQRLLVDQEMIEFICNENERSTNHMEAPPWMKGETRGQLGPDRPLRNPAK